MLTKTVIILHVCRCSYGISEKYLFEISVIKISVVYVKVHLSEVKLCIRLVCMSIVH